MTDRRLGMLAVLLMAACGTRSDLETERSALLRLHEAQRTAHLEKDADLLVSMLADDFISIDGGRIVRRSREENRDRFQAYFDAVEFGEWEDISPPVVRVSGDGTMAYVIVHKRVRVRSVGGEAEQHAVFAWMETYEKRGGEWKLMALASTERSVEGSSTEEGDG